MTRHPTLFGRRMTHGRKVDYYLLGAVIGQEIGIEKRWYGSTGDINVNGFATHHAAARALERKIVAAHRRLGKLMGIGGGK